MVEVTVLFEGGAQPHESAAVETMDNSDQLRIAFSKLLNSGLDNQNVRIVTAPIYSNRNIRTVVANWKPDEYVLIDLDGPPSQRSARIKDSGLTPIQDNVFFMIQAMEAWILSQPKVIDKTFSALSNQKTNAAQDESLLDRHPENIHHPDRILQAILARHFVHTKAGKTKKLVYGKLRHAPDLLKNLDIKLLRGTFSDVDALLKAIQRLA